MTVGVPGDATGQLSTLRATMNALVQIKSPGEIIHLQFEWEDPNPRLRTHPSVPPPITTYLKSHPFQFLSFMKRDFPE
jgi:hypothetical protein